MLSLLIRRGRRSVFFFSTLLIKPIVRESELQFSYVQSNVFFDKVARQQAKGKLEKKKGMSSSEARQDLNSFFDTLGLDGNRDHKAAKPALKPQVAKPEKTTVNIYVKESSVDKSAPKKSHAVARLRSKKEKKGPPIPLSSKARQEELADRPESRFEREMHEAKALLRRSKMADALSQARSISLKADAPYYTS